LPRWLQSARNVHIGIDFDNTIVCYDGVFHAAALERGLITREVATDKTAVRDCLRAAGREDDWTELQGYVYGMRMALASLYPGVVAFIRAARAAGAQVSIVSHKTRWPYRGAQCDLHAAAHRFLDDHGFFDPARVGLVAQSTFFEVTKEEKLARIGRVGCTHFVDDLPEFLVEPGFPKRTQRILFDPGNRYPNEDKRFLRARSWQDIGARLLDASASADD
jgi:hypothetical protein